MEQKEAFKEFVKKNPKLIKYVKSGDMDWQKFYEIYALYGEEDTAWDEYLKEDTSSAATQAAAAATAAAGTFGIADALNWIKNVDLNSIQNGVTSVQRVLGLLQDFSKKDTGAPKKEEYKPRPLYRHFED